MEGGGGVCFAFPFCFFLYDIVPHSRSKALTQLPTSRVWAGGEGSALYQLCTEDRRQGTVFSYIITAIFLSGVLHHGKVQPYGERYLVCLGHAAFSFWHGLQLRCCSGTDIIYYLWCAGPGCSRFFFFFFLYTLCISCESGLVE